MADMDMGNMEKEGMDKAKDMTTEEARKKLGTNQQDQGDQSDQQNQQ